MNIQIYSWSKSWTKTFCLPLIFYESRDFLYLTRDINSLEEWVNILKTLKTSVLSTQQMQARHIWRTRTYLYVIPYNTPQEGRNNSALTLRAATCVLHAASQHGLLAQDHAHCGNMASGLEITSVFKLKIYIQSILISTCNELCRYTIHLRYGILGQNRDTVFPGLSAAAVWLTAIARNLKVTVSCLSDSV